MTNSTHCFILDFETHPIVGSPAHKAPKPVSLAFRYPNSTGPGFVHWGHKEHYDTQGFDAAKRILNIAWSSGAPLLFHNAGFDLAVALQHFDMPMPGAQKFHDTMILAYLHEPNAFSLALKTLAQRICKIEPEERDAVREWLLEHRIITKSQKNWGAHIWEAPPAIVGPYAMGDVNRTAALFDELMPIIESRDSTAAYLNERRMVAITNDMSARGVRVNRQGMSAATANMTLGKVTADGHIRRMLRSPSLSVDSNEELADALDAADAVSQWAYTPSGQRSTARDSLMKFVKDPQLAHLLAYRGQLATIDSTFLTPWLELSKDDGRLHPSWHSVRGPAGGGTRTGRLSCTDPNLMNPMNGEQLLEPPMADLPVLPNVREFLLPEEGQVWVAADFHSQEIRLLGHYAEGALMELYKSDPTADSHAAVQKWVSDRFGRDISRKAIKIIVFSTLYGAGAASIASRLDIGVAEAQELIKAVLDAMTGVPSLRKELQARGDAGGDVRTYGGRLLQAPFDKAGRRRGYALLNALIQGSAADVTKQAIINYDGWKEDGVMLATVHDELDISVDMPHMEQEIELLTAAMERMNGLDVPMRATVKCGFNWGAIKDYEK